MSMCMRGLPELDMLLRSVSLSYIASHIADR